jgi:hypothetical protein
MGEHAGFWGLIAWHERLNGCRLWRGLAVAKVELPCVSEAGRLGLVGRNDYLNALIAELLDELRIRA